MYVKFIYLVNECVDERASSADDPQHVESGGAQV